MSTIAHIRIGLSSPLIGRCSDLPQVPKPAFSAAPGPGFGNPPDAGRSASALR